MVQEEAELTPLMQEMHREMLASQRIVDRLNLRKLSTKNHQETGELLLLQS